MTKEMFEKELEAIDENDPEVENELFETMKFMGQNRRTLLIQENQHGMENGSN